MADKSSERAAKIPSASKRAPPFPTTTKIGGIVSLGYVGRMVTGAHSSDLPSGSWTLFEEFSRIHVGLSSISQQAAKEINEDNVPPVEDTARMKKAHLAGLDTRGKATEPSFLRKHKEPMGEASTEGPEGHNAPITAAVPAVAATGAF
ncbi:hypothetical protein AgCh_022005 [Apium graveolens]